MSVEENKLRMREFAEAFNRRDWSAMESCLAPGFMRHSVAAPGVSSRDALLAYLRAEFITFPDAIETIDDMVGEGDKLAVRHHFRGTQVGSMGPFPPTGRVMEADYLAIYRFEGGRIAEAWVEWDNLAGLVQLGHLMMPGA